MTPPRSPSLRGIGIDIKLNEGPGSSHHPRASAMLIMATATRRVGVLLLLAVAAMLLIAGKGPLEWTSGWADRIRDQTIDAQRQAAFADAAALAPVPKEASPPLNIVVQPAPPRPPRVEVALLTAYSEEPKTFGIETLKSKREYARYWGYDLHVSVNESMPETREESWNKIFALRRSMDENPNTEWFWFTDADLMIMAPEKSVEEHVLGPLNLIPGPTSDNSTFFVVASDCNCLNAGSFLLRNSDAGRTFIDLLLDPLLSEFDYSEQDAMSHLFSHHPRLVADMVLAPQRMINSYPPSSCPVAQAAFAPAAGEWDVDLNDRVRIVEGYQYGPVENLGWDIPMPPSNWHPFTPQLEIIDSDGETVEVRDQTPEEAMEEYREEVKQAKERFFPLLLNDDGSPPMSAPGTEFAVTRELSPKEKKTAEWQWWHESMRLRHGGHHWQEGDFTVHMAGCWMIEGNCEAHWKHYTAARGSIANLPKRRHDAPRYDFSKFRDVEVIELRDRPADEEQVSREEAESGADSTAPRVKPALASDLEAAKVEGADEDEDEDDEAGQRAAVNAEQDEAEEDEEATVGAQEFEGEEETDNEGRRHRSWGSRRHLRR